MDKDPTLHKLAIPGPILASLLHRISSSLGDVDGLLFGHVTLSSSPSLSDDSSSSTTQLTATVTSFLSPSSSPHSLPSLLHPQHPHLLGWFSSRRRSPLRPSLREFSLSHSLSNPNPNKVPNFDTFKPNPTSSSNKVPNFDATKLSPTSTSYKVPNFDTIKLAPCVFLLFSTPLQDQIIHTHEYRAYQYCPAKLSFEPISIDVVNIGPAFRGHYGAFLPTNSGFFPVLGCELRGSNAMNEDGKEDEEKSLREMREEGREQREVDRFAVGFRVGDLRRLVGPEASDSTLRLEDLYEKMLDKVEALARQVEVTNAKVLEQENHNRKLRYRIARGGLE